MNDLEWAVQFAQELSELLGLDNDTGLTSEKELDLFEQFDILPEDNQ